MIRTRSRLGFLAGAALLGAVSTVALAWACTAQPSRMGFSPAAGPQGTALTIEGSGFTPGQLEVRWNALDGPVIGQGAVAAGSPTFSVKATIPNAAPGVYYAVVVQHGLTGAVSAKAVDTFELTAGSALASGVPSTSDLWQGFAQSNGAQVQGVSAGARLTDRGPNSALGLALAATGMLSLFSLLAVMMVRARKRSSAT